MKLFTMRELNAAYDHAQAGGQALHVHRIIANRTGAPNCFKAAVAKGEQIAHLFDRDADRLAGTVRSLGVRVVVVEGRGTRYQHVDLCGGPLRKALAMCRGGTTLFPPEVP